MANLVGQFAIVEQVLEAQNVDGDTQALLKKPGFTKGTDGSVRFNGRLVVPTLPELRRGPIA